MMQCRQLLIALLCLCPIVGAGPLQAQPADEVVVHTNLPVVFSSQWPHWENTLYRWTVRGSGFFGDAGTNLRIVADARFVLGEVNNFPNPRLPLNDNADDFTEYCERISDPCNMYLATNALSGNGYVLGRLRPSNASEMKPFRFVPQLDVYNPEHVYTVEVTGSGGPGEFMFVDQYNRDLGPAVQEFYNDNFTGEDTTQFFIQIERLSPQLLVRDPEAEEIINQPDEILRTTDLEFGLLSVNQGSRQIQRVLLNGGLQDLEITNIEVEAPRQLDRNQFRVTRSDGQPLGTPVTLRHNIDELGLTIEFDPLVVDVFSATLRVFCNDPNQNEGTGSFFSFTLSGEGTDAAVSFREDAGATEVLADVDFGNIHVDNNGSTQVVIRSDGSSLASGVKLEGLDAPFRARASWGNGAIDLDSDDSRTIDIDFDTTLPGRFTDTLNVSGLNFSPQRLILHAYSYFDSVVIFHNWDRRHDLRDTIDFGYRAAGEKYDTLSFFVRNYGNMEAMFVRNQKTGPDYVIERVRNTGNQVISDTEHFDDDLIEVLPPNHIFPRRPLDLPGSYSEREFRMIFRGDHDDLGDVPSGLKLVKFDFWLRDTVDTSRIFKKEFAVRAVKTNSLLVAEPPILDFGFVYLDTEKEENAELENCGEAIEAMRAQLIDQNPAGNNFDLWVDIPAFPTQMAANQKLPVTFRYTPTDMGPDRAEFKVAYTTQGDDARDDSTRIQVRGFGVQQKLTFTDLSSESIAPTVEDRGDTVIIDLGEVNACNDDRTFSFRLRNDGNFPYGVKSVKRRTNSVDNGFIIENLPTNGQSLEPNEFFGPILVTFAPLIISGQGVEQEVERIIESDIVDRVANSPDSVRTLVLVFRARPVSADLATEVLGPLDEQERLNFDSLTVLTDCLNEREYALRVVNSGNLDLRLDNVNLNTPEIFTFSGATNRVLRPGTSDTIYIRFQPNSIGFVFDTLRFNHNGGCPDSTFALPLVGVGVAPPSLKVDIPKVTRARPGSIIDLPLLLPRLAMQQQLSDIQSIKVELDYNPTLLQFEDFQTAGSASIPLSRDDISASETDGHLRLEIRSSDALVESDTLLRLRFRTYVGDAVLTPININGIEIGNSLCPEVVSVDTVGSGGMFVADSVCGVHVLTVGNSSGILFNLRPPTPNPIEGDIAIEYEVAYATDVQIALFNSMGILVRQVATGKHPSGVYRAELSGAELAAGTYYCVMRAGIYSATHTMVKAR